MSGPDPLPRYEYLPWTRRGIAAVIDQIDHLGTTPDAGPAGRATVTATLTVEARPVHGAPEVGPTSVRRAVPLVGPADVAAFAPSTVQRSVPAPGFTEATPGELAYVEFYDEDLPWRYTPAAATADNRLRPWITLVVLEDGEYTLLERPGAPSVLTVDPGAPLPPATETWAWAHVQVTGTLLPDASDVDSFVAANPDRALSRLVGPRRLLPGRAYRAFVVPTFEGGRLAGLGESGLGVPAQKQAWDAGGPRSFPVLHDWWFRTGEDSGFENLVRSPTARTASVEGAVRQMDVADPGAGLPVTPGATLGLEGALQPVDFAPDPVPAGTAAALTALVDLTEDFREEGTGPLDDPIVTPPAYGRAPADLRRVGDAGPELSWVRELNEDPRNRVAAALGARIVAERDEELMERAWQQVGELGLANQRLREADLALATAEQLFAKHLVAGDIDRVLTLTATAHSVMTGGGARTLRGEIDDSRVPAAAQSPTFRRIVRPATHLVRAVTPGQDAGALVDGLLSGLNKDPGSTGAVSAAPPAPDPGAGVPLATVQLAVAEVAAQQATLPPTPRGTFLALVRDELAGRAAAGTLASIPGGNPLPAELVALRVALLTRLDARPPAAGGDPPDLRSGVQELVAAVLRVEVAHDAASVVLVPATFARLFGDGVDGKTFEGITVQPDGSALQNTATTAAAGAGAVFAQAVGLLVDVSADRPPVPPARPLDPPTSRALAGRLDPHTTLPARVDTVVGGLGVDLTEQVAQRRRIRPVLAHPRFPDPLLEPLRAISQDHVLPNVAAVPAESITLMEPNDRFVESLMAGASTEMARELLWREYPTDLRGTYFDRFWDARDAGRPDPEPDITPLHLWENGLGTHSGRSSALLVLVVRAKLLVKFPDTVVFAQQAIFLNGTSGPRALDDAGTVHHPVLTGRLEPDIRLYGFALDPLDAKGSETKPGYFFCFMERPGQVRFGLDTQEPVPALSTWDDLNWGHLGTGAGRQVLLAANPIAPTTPGLAPWNATSAHTASILFQSPVLMARHASDMLEGPA